MTQRVIKLPGVHQLTKDQEMARSLPLDGQYLIIGGPGTGKSVVALLRVKQLVDQKKEYVFLVFNHLLKHSCFLLAEQKLVAEQWQGWFVQLYKNALQVKNVPRLPKKEQQKYADFDWDTIVSNAQAHGPLENADALPYLVVDEGQDMPRQFYQMLAELGYENFFVVADQNQQLVTGENSSRQDIENALGIEVGEVVELKNNHRNHYATARLARAFYTGDPASPPPELPPAPKHNVLKPLLFNYQEQHFKTICKRIVLMANAYPTKLVAVLTPNNRSREIFVEQLRQQAQLLEQTSLLISTYQHGATENIPFNRGGVMVINAQACKGLEFDVVFIADIDKYHAPSNDLDQLKKLFYVMSSRAIDRLLLLSASSQDYPAYPIIPTDADILEIK
ncbi:MAG TPA: AAA family ATPase [Marinospirillum sp.]|uniref:AAA family ATPase n=1 Tax=Marinospirillum sp. TaxID=2183934 RepID=UPI002B46EC80|nr:AAA family ATPase [Marinospirillum sp.]HKM15561.1 AAA family ATPase [Marinospirillum sp.]